MATIYDVAKAAGVSPKTVSRVLNGDAPVGQSTRRSVEAAIRQLGYVPSKAARMMRSNKSGLVGLITGAISNSPEPAEPRGLPDLLIVQGIQQAIADSGKTLMIADTAGSSDRVSHLVQTFLEHRAEGLIYVADYHQQVALPPLPADCPLVLANCFDNAGHPAIVPDDRTGQRDLVRKLIESGHRRIGFLTLDRTMVAASLRYQGYRDALAEYNLAYDDQLVAMAVEIGNEKDNTLLSASIDRLLGLSDRPTVICCGNDEMAMRLYGLLAARGLRVPEDISVAGYDNYRIIAETLTPPLTTIELPYFAMGQAAAQRLLNLTEGRSDRAETKTLVSGPLVWRSSVAAMNSVSVLKPRGRNNA